jgi:hypothetical protein
MSKSAAGKTGLRLINELHRLEMRAEQLQIHLSSSQPQSADARASAAELATVRRQITRIKAKCREVEPALMLSRSNPRCLH